MLRSIIHLIWSSCVCITYKLDTAFKHLSHQIKYQVIFNVVVVCRYLNALYERFWKMLESFCSAMKWDIKNWLCTITKIQRIEHKRPIKIVNTDMLLAIWFPWYNPQYSTSILYTKYRECNKIDWVVPLRNI